MIHISERGELSNADGKRKAQECGREVKWWDCAKFYPYYVNISALWHKPGSCARVVWLLNNRESLWETNVGISLYILVKTWTAVDVNDTTDQKGMNQSGSRKKHNSWLPGATWSQERGESLRKGSIMKYAMPVNIESPHYPEFMSVSPSLLVDDILKGYLEIGWRWLGNLLISTVRNIEIETLSFLGSS